MENNLIYKKATIEDITLLTKTRIEVLRAANQLSELVDMSLVEVQSVSAFPGNADLSQPIRMESLSYEYVHKPGVQAQRDCISYAGFTD